MNLTPKEQLLASIGVFCGIFLAAIEGTVVATAMPTAVKSLGGISLIHFVFASYQLASTTSIPIWGKLGERWGLRSTFVLGCLIFLLGGMTCGTTHNIYQLIAARFLQGKTLGEGFDNLGRAATGLAQRALAIADASADARLQG